MPPSPIGPTQGSASGLLPTSVFNALVPKEGPKIIRQIAPFSQGVTTFLIDLTQAVQNGTISVVQAVYVDNWENPYPVSIAIQGTTQSIDVPPYTEGYFPLLANNPPVFAVTSPGNSSVNVPLFLINVPVPCASWSQPSASTSTPATWVDADNTTIASGGTAVTVFAAGEITHAAMIANPPSATESLFISATGDADTTAGGGTIELAPGGSYQFGPCSNAISANAATDGHVFSAMRS